MLNFLEIKNVRLTDIAAKYGLRLRFKGDWASAPCPLPTHKEGDKGRSFTINLAQNYWRCFSASCNENNSGKKGGDCINFVALMENCRERDAAQKIADWYGLNGAKQKPPTNEGVRTTCTRGTEASSHSTAPEAGSESTKNRPQIETGTAPRKELALDEEPKPAKRSPDNTSGALAVKSGYIHALDDWFNELFQLGPELVNDEFWKQRRSAVKGKCIESYRNGKVAAHG